MCLDRDGFSGDSQVTAKLDQVDELLRSRSVPGRLAQRVHNFFAFSLRRQMDSEHTSVMNGKQDMPCTGAVTRY